MKEVLVRGLFKLFLNHLLYNNDMEKDSFFEETIEVNGTKYSTTQLIKIGRKRREKIRWIFRAIGIGGIVTAMVLMCFAGLYVELFLSIAGLVACFTIPPFIVSFNIARNADFKEWGILELDPDYFKKKEEAIKEGIKLEVVSKTIVLSKDKGEYFLLDINKKQFQIIANKTISDILTIKDFRSFAMQVDDQVVTSYDYQTKSGSGVAGAVVGGLLFGGVGAIAGSIAGSGADVQNSGTQTSQINHTYILRIRTYNLKTPSFVFVLDSLDVAEEIMSILEILSSE